MINSDLFNRDPYAFAEVQLWFTVLDYETGDNVNYLCLTRTVDKRSKSQYFISENQFETHHGDKSKPGEKVSRELVQETLKHYGIDINFPERFIILQHTTVRLSQKKPTDLMDELETLMGLDDLKQEIISQKAKGNELKSTLNTLNQQHMASRVELNALQPKIDEFNEYITELNTFKKREEWYKRKEMRMNRWKYCAMKKEIHAKRDEREKCTRKSEVLDIRVKEQSSEIERMRLSINERNLVIANLSSQVEALMEEKDHLTNETDKYQNTVKGAQRKLGSLRKQLETMVENEEQYTQLKMELTSRLSDQSELMKNIEEEEVSTRFCFSLKQ